MGGWDSIGCIVSGRGGLDASVGSRSVSWFLEGGKQYTQMLQIQRDFIKGIMARCPKGLSCRRRDGIARQTKPHVSQIASGYKLGIPYSTVPPTLLSYLVTRTTTNIRQSVQRLEQAQPRFMYGRPRTCSIILAYIRGLALPCLGLSLSQRALSVSR
jgi:hypothetical protein